MAEPLARLEAMWRSLGDPSGEALTPEGAADRFGAAFCGLHARLCVKLLSRLRAQLAEEAAQEEHRADAWDRLVGVPVDVGATTPGETRGPDGGALDRPRPSGSENSIEYETAPDAATRYNAAAHTPRGRKIT